MKYGNQTKNLLWILGKTLYKFFIYVLKTKNDIFNSTNKFPNRLISARLQPLAILKNHVYLQICRQFSTNIKTKLIPVFSPSL